MQNCTIYFTCLIFIVCAIFFGLNIGYIFKKNSVPKQSQWSMIEVILKMALHCQQAKLCFYTFAPASLKVCAHCCFAVWHTPRYGIPGIPFAISQTIHWKLAQTSKCFSFFVDVIKPFSSHWERRQLILAFTKALGYFSSVYWFSL